MRSDTAPRKPYGERHAWRFQSGTLHVEKGRRVGRGFRQVAIVFTDDTRESDLTIYATIDGCTQRNRIDRAPVESIARQEIERRDEWRYSTIKTRETIQ